VNLVWLARARHDLRHLAEYIELRNPSAATKVEHRLRAAVEHLQQFPRTGRISRTPNTREIVLSEYPYIIRYRVTDGAVQILRIFHASMDWPAQ
jgi:toxin ParE1/3/4